jgi:asparagine synthase (glutamine-hydrolysing)
MCGIVAHFAPDGGNSDDALVAQLARRLRHRGPDGEGAKTLGRASLGHTRLAIVDVGGGEQPMLGEAFGSLMVCNGEVYNHAELRRQLTERHRFATNSDSEVIVHLYEERGKDCVEELDGMFAFFASDGDSFLAARDAFGIKPLYYGRTADDAWLFASEAKIVGAYCQRFTALRPGSLITERGEQERWFRPAWELEVGRQRDVDLQQLTERLEVAVTKRFMADVPLGVLLSGGLDSSIVAALSARHLPNLMTFAVGAAGAADLDAARQVARALGTRHFEHVYSAKDAARVLPEVIRQLESYDPALIRSAVPGYFVSALAASHVKIVLTGEGADEVFGGYDYFSGIDSRLEFHRECVRLLFGLYGMNLQRVDRMTMAHGIEGRVPFLDVGFVDYVMRIDPALKMWGGARSEKALLRAAFADVLPSAVTKRRKLEFSRGAGGEAPLRELAERKISDRDLLLSRARFPVDSPVTKEELLYREIFSEIFPGETFRAAVRRWQPPTRSQPSWEVS